MPLSAAVADRPAGKVSATVTAGRQSAASRVTDHELEAAAAACRKPPGSLTTIVTSGSSTSVVSLAVSLAVFSARRRR